MDTALDVYEADVRKQPRVDPIKHVEDIRVVRQLETELWRLLLKRPAFRPRLREILRPLGPFKRLSAPRLLQLDAHRLYLINCTKEAESFRRAPRWSALIRQKRLRLDAQRSKVVGGNLRLVLRVAHSAVRGSQSGAFVFEDLIQEGNMGLLTAVHKFDPNRGVRFSTYAMWWIRQAVLRFLGTQMSDIRVPSHVHQSLSAAAECRNKLARKLGRTPTVEEVAKEAGIKTKKLEALLASRRERVSLDQAPERTPTFAPQDWLADDSPSAEERAAKDAQMRLLAELVSELSDRDQLILAARFGLGGAEEKTLHDLGDQLGVTRERVRQLEARTLDELGKRIRRRQRFGRPFAIPTPAPSSELAPECSDSERAATLPKNPLKVGDRVGSAIVRSVTLRDRGSYRYQMSCSRCKRHGTLGGILVTSGVGCRRCDGGARRASVAAA